MRIHGELFQCDNDCAHTVYGDDQWPKFGSSSSVTGLTGTSLAPIPAFVSHEMLRSLCLNVFVLAFALAENGEGSDRPPNPSLEILMHLPPGFQDVNSFLSYLKNVGNIERAKEEADFRRKREITPGHEGESEDATEGDALLESPPVQSALTDGMHDPLAVPLMDLREGIMRSMYPPYELKDVHSVNDNEDRVQRDKRTFMDGSGGERESSTALPFWKRKKESPPFVTGRDNSGQKSSSYQPAQHRSLDNARESHSMKDLDKTVVSNEITRNNQDSIFSSTSRRTHNSRQAESYTPRTPKSVYDTIDYTNRRRTQEGRNGFGRNFDSKPQTSEKREQFARQYAYPRPYDRPYYPFQGDVVGRGIEYYHRTFDPSSGRIIYYANMPDPSRHYDPNFSYDPSGRSIYVNGRTYLYDPYGRSYINPVDYRFSNIYGRSGDYLRNGRSNLERHYQGPDNSQRIGRFNVLGDRTKDDFRNRTYVIFDAEESSADRRIQQPYIPQDFSRYPIPPYGLPYPTPVVPPYQDYYRNQYYPTVQTPMPWSTTKPILGITTSNYVTRPLNVPEVQIPLSTRNRGLHPLGDYDKMRKT